MNPVAETNEAVDALPVFQPPATLGEVWDANWTAAGLSTPFGVAAPRRQAVQELSDAYRRVTGRDPFADAAAAGTPIALPGMGPGVQATAGVIGEQQARAPGRDLSTSADARDLTSAISTLADRLPDAQKTQLGPFLDVDGRAANIAQKAEQDAAAVNQRAYGLSGVGTSYVAGLARGLADPTTLLGAFAGGPEAGGLLSMLGREFAVNAGFGAATHEIVAPQREQLGLESGSLVGDALESGTFGAGLGLLLRGAGWTLRQAMGKAPSGEAAPAGFRPNPAPPPDLHAEAGALAPEDFEAAARQQDRDTAIDAQAPVQTMPGRIEAREATDAAAARIESGEGATLAPAPLNGEIIAPDRGGIRTPDGFVTIPDHPRMMQTALDDAVQSGWITPEQAAQYASERATSRAGTIEFRGKSYDGASPIEAVMAAARDTGISVDRVWDEVMPERLEPAAVAPDEEANRAGQGEPTGQPAPDAEAARPAAPVKPLDEAAAAPAGEGANPATEPPAAATKPLADATPGVGLAPQRADVERALAAAGGDAKIQAPEGEVSAREQLGLVDEFKAAAKELAGCILKFGNGE